MSNKKDFHSLLRLVKQTEGWRVVIGQGGHFRITPPTGPIIFLPSTPSEYRGFKNAKALLRRSGWKHR